MDWFRVWHSILDKPKFARLSPSAIGYWTLFACAASRSVRRGLLPDDYEELAMIVRRDPEEVAEMVAVLLEAGLLERRANGHVGFYKWDEYQPPSTERAAKSRDAAAAAAAAAATNATSATNATNATSTTKAAQATERRREEREEIEVVVGGAGADAPPAIESTPKGFPIRSDGHRDAIAKARELFGDDLAEAVADQGQAIEYAIHQSDGPRWDCYVAALEHAKRSTKPISNVLVYALRAAERFAAHGIPPPPVAFQGAPPPRAAPPGAPPKRRLSEEEVLARLPNL